MVSIIDYNAKNSSVTAHIQEVMRDKKKSQELIQTLNDVTTNLDTKEIILDMGGIEKIINNEIGTFFGPWFKQAKDNKITISIDNASEQVIGKMRRIFRDTINGLSHTLQSDPE